MGSYRSLAWGVLGGLLGEALRLPAGALLGALVAVATVNVLTDARLTIHPGFRLPSRVLIGACIGSLATPALARTLGASLPWVAAATVVTLVLSLLFGLLFARLARVDRRTALLACCPGGIAEMAALAEDSRADTELVLGVHLIRKIAVLLGVVVAAGLL